MRRLAFTMLLLALACAYGAAKDETVDELKLRFESARAEERPELGIRIAQQQLRNADTLYSKGNVDAGPRRRRGRCHLFRESARRRHANQEAS